MFQYIISCKNRNKILLPDDHENVKLRVAVTYLIHFSCNQLYIALVFYMEQYLIAIYILYNEYILYVLYIYIYIYIYYTYIHYIYYIYIQNSSLQLCPSIYSCSSLLLDDRWSHNPTNYCSTLTHNPHNYCNTLT